MYIERKRKTNGYNYKKNIYFCEILNFGPILNAMKTQDLKCLYGVHVFNKY